MALGQRMSVVTWDEQWTETKTIEKWLKPDEMVVQLARTLTIHGKLRPGGHFFVTLKSTEGWLYGEGIEIEKNTFLRPGKGVPVHFSTEDEIETLFGNFDLVEKKYRCYAAKASQKRHASWKI